MYGSRLAVGVAGPGVRPEVELLPPRRLASLLAGLFAAAGPAEVVEADAEAEEEAEVGADDTSAATAEAFGASSGCCGAGAGALESGLAFGLAFGLTGPSVSATRFWAEAGGWPESWPPDWFWLAVEATCAAGA